MPPARRLEIREPGRAPGQLPIATTVEFGREGQGIVVLDDSKVSRRHARVELTDGGLVVSDIGSTNGTFVDEFRIAAPTAVAGGDDPCRRPSYGGNCSDVNWCESLKCSRVNCTSLICSLNRAQVSAASGGGAWNLLGSFHTSIG